MTHGSDSQERCSKVFTHSSERGRRDLQVLGRLDLTCCHRAAMRATIMLLCVHSRFTQDSHTLHKHCSRLQSQMLTNKKSNQI